MDEFEKTPQMFALQRVVSPRSANGGSAAALLRPGVQAGE